MTSEREKKYQNAIKKAHFRTSLNDTRFLTDNFPSNLQVRFGEVSNLKTMWKENLVNFHTSLLSPANNCREISSVYLSAQDFVTSENFQ
jgi:hypothetical protein